ncbi:hypothetical protein [Methylobacterium sp. SI9]|uniref:hypothetical protein n=1 Tax=Methylobacterium guangdongense TaxID=3138811 RepID=UPI00313D0EC5
MPFYVIVLTVGNTNDPVGLFEANDDADAAVQYPAGVPQQYRGVMHQLSYRRCTFDALEYHPRMARPQLGTNSYINMPGPGPLYIMAENAQMTLPHNANSLSSSINQLSVLVDNIKDVFRSVEPDQNNLSVYGHNIRNLLLLAAMEFENECKGIMSANGYVPQRGQNYWSTVDFVKLLQPLRLAEFEVRLRYYPAIQPRIPFANWSDQAPTQSLPWYEAYNATKHDRENNFSRATVEHAIDALTACAIMHAAQYRNIKIWKDQIGDFFHFWEYPEWAIEDRYVNRKRPNHPPQWVPVLYNFP